jgi:hypothetical protein
VEAFIADPAHLGYDYLESLRRVYDFWLNWNSSDPSARSRGADDL